MTSFKFIHLFRFLILFFHVLVVIITFLYDFWSSATEGTEHKDTKEKKTEIYSFTHSEISLKDKPESHNKCAKDRCMCRPVQAKNAATVSGNSCVHLDCNIFFLVSSIPSVFTRFMPTLSRGFLNWERDLMETYHFPLTIARSFFLCIMSGCGLLCLSSSTHRAHRLGSILTWLKVRELEVISVPSRLLSTVQMTGMSNIQN